MRSLGIRAVRIYTIHPPAFYRELVRYNDAHSEAPLYLVQGVYLPDETYPERPRGLYDPAVSSAFDDELSDAASALHRTLTRSPERGRASGRWRADVSPWLVAWSAWNGIPSACSANRGRASGSRPATGPSRRRSATSQNGAERLTSRQGRRAIATPTMTAPAPTASGHVSRSPRRRAASTRPESG